MSRNFDAIVIGSGLGGLTAGALFARAGHRVLVLERNHNFGGAATVYRHGGLSIEASLHEIDGLDAERPQEADPAGARLDRDIPFVDVGDLHEVRSPLFEKPFLMPHGFAAALRGYKRAFSRKQPMASTAIFRSHRCGSARRAMMSEHQDDRSWWLLNAPTLPWRLWPLDPRPPCNLERGVATAVRQTTRRSSSRSHPTLLITPTIPTRCRSSILPFRRPPISRAADTMFAAARRCSATGWSPSFARPAARSRPAAKSKPSCWTAIAPAACAIAREHRRRQGRACAGRFRQCCAIGAASMLPRASAPTFMSRLPKPSSVDLTMVDIARTQQRFARFGVRHYSTSVLPAWLTTLSSFREAAAVPREDSGAGSRPMGSSPTTRSIPG